MADEPTAVPAVEAPAPAAEPVDIAAPPNDAPVEAPITKDDEEIAGKQATTEVNPPDGTVAAEAAVGPSSVVPEQAQTPTSVKATPKRTPGGAGEHKKAKGKRKSMPVLHLECQPGEYYWARLKGHPPWPAIVCDEQMLPESLLATRPVSAARPDGSLRDDFKDGGKNAKERTFPIMFLSTNEFAWMINTSLTPLDPKECETLPSGKATKALQDAYRIATEAHDLDYFKNILKLWQEEQAQIEKEGRELDERRAREAEERQKKATEDGEEGKKKKKNRKSKGGDDVVMEDADTPKSTKKRKKDVESDADGAKPKKTPKVTKINAPKTPNGDTSVTKKSSAKPKKKVVSAPKEKEEEKPQMTEEERLATLEKAVLYLRHRLQKGFLSRDQAPQESEMAAMAEFFKQLETYEALDPSIIRRTKIHKVLKAIVKLSSIPKDEEFRFKKRSAAMLEIWNKRMEADGAAPPSATDAKPTTLPDLTAEKLPETNGVTEANGEGKDTNGTEVEAKPDASAEKIEDTIVNTDEDKKDATTILATDAAKNAEHEDVTMGEATDSKPVPAEPATEVSV